MITDFFQRQFAKGSALNRFIIINCIVFLTITVVNIAFNLFNIPNVLDYTINLLGLHSNIRGILLHPWGIITHMFLHVDFMHLLFNMLLLYMAGNIFIEYLGEKRFTATYLLGGLCGALLYVAAYNIFPKFDHLFQSSFAYGASAAVLAILIAAAVYVPEYGVNLILLGRVKLIYIAIAFVVLDLVQFNKGNAGGHIAHLGGALFGYLVASRYKKGTDITRGMVRLMNNLSEMLKPMHKSKLKVVHSNKKFLSDEDYNITKLNEQKVIDDILDKINRSGYGSLTKLEKELLVRISEKKK